MYLSRGCRNHDGQRDRRHHWTSRANSSNIFGSRLPHSLAPHAATRLPPVAASSDRPLGFLIFSIGDCVSRLSITSGKRSCSSTAGVQSPQPLPTNFSVASAWCHCSTQTCVLIYPAACFARVRQNLVREGARPLA